MEETRSTSVVAHKTIQLLFLLYSEIENKEGYDTTVWIPTNLADSIYILQTAMLVGNGFGVYYSCGNLSITGGNPRFNCKSNEDPITYPCFKSGGPNIIGYELHTGEKLSVS